MHGGPKPHHVHGTVGARGDEQPPPQWDGHLRQQAPPEDESQAVCRRMRCQPRARGRAGARWLGTLALLMGEGSVGNWGWVVGSAALRRLFQRPGHPAGWADWHVRMCCARVPLSLRCTLCRSRLAQALPPPARPSRRSSAARPYRCRLRVDLPEISTRKFPKDL